MIFSLLDERDLPEEIRAWFDQLTRSQAGESSAADYLPSLDVFETATALEIFVDLPGVAPDSLRVVMNKDVLIIAGQKRPGGSACDEGAVFHLVERSFGRFARAVRLNAAVDAAAARASLRSGELRVMVPKIAERRGVRIDVPLERLND